MTTAEVCEPTIGESKENDASEMFAFPVSSSQQRLWVLEQLQPGQPLYNVPVAVRLEGTLDAAVLEQAFNQVVRRHEALRTSFDLQNGQPVQIVSPSLQLKVQETDLRTLPESARAVEVKRLAGDEARQPFDLRCLPLLRARLLKLSGNEHVFLLTAHHIIFDGWSLPVFFRELAEFYQSACGDTPPPLPELPIQYADYAVWQRNRLKSIDRELAWWKKHLAGPLPVLELPSDRPRPSVQSYRGAVESLSLGGPLRDNLRSLGQREGVTLFMTLLAAFQALLHRYTGQEDILIGSPVAGRTLTETEGLIGLFINTVVFRGNLSGNPAFRELLARLRGTALDAFANEEVPFERLVEELQPERNLSHSPLFQVMFALERSSWDEIEWPGLKLTPIELDSGTAKFDLTLYLAESASGLTARMEYSTDLFDGATIQRMLGHFRVLLEGIATAPDCRISDLPVLTDAERRRLLVEWNDTRGDYPRDKTLHEFFEAQAAATPDAVAIAFGDQHLTYGELNASANQVAHHLQKIGVRPDTLVGICFDRSLQMLAGLLGVLKAGGAYVPLDPAYPKERLAFMLEDSRAAVIVTQRRWLDVLPKGRAPTVCLDTEWKAISREDRQRLSLGAGPENLAYVIYTSGSTGKPKGVQIPHRTVVNFLNSMRQTPGFAKGDVLLAVTTLSFDIAGLELFLPLTVGARVVLATREEAADGAQLAAKIAKNGVTVMQATPVTWRMLLDSGWEGNKTLRVFCGGEALSRELANRLLERCAEVWNLYGPTETTIWSTVAAVKRGNGPIVVGRPIANTQIYVLDRHFQPVPIGVPGELFIGGGGLARGYLNRPELTAEKFIHHPVSDDANARLYRTGDVARWRADGNLELLGRLDHQVKIRGFRVELDEIESALLHFPAVREAVVVVREDASGDKRLVAYLTSYKQSTVSLNELRRFLREKLPDYMAPSAFVLLDQLPLTPNGKVDRRALPAPGNDRSQLETSFAAPRAGFEQTLAAVWEEVLGVKNPGANDNFFDLGGHSLQVVQVQHILRERLGVDLPVTHFFQHPTLRSLARFISEEKKEEPFLQKIRERTQRQQAAALRSRPFGARVKV